MSLWSKLRGTAETSFQVGLGGPQLKANAGNIEARNSSDAAFVIVRGATPVAANDLVTKAYADLGDAPFTSILYMDPNYAGGLNNGSPSTPFTTIAACWTAFAAASITSGIIYVPATTISENIVFPVSGDWEIAGQTIWGLADCILSGSIDLTSTAADQRRALSNVQLTGAITGNAPTGAFCRCVITNAIIHTGAGLTLTATAGGGWRASFVGRYPGGKQQSISRCDTVATIAGTITSSLWRFILAPVFSGTSEFYSTEFDAGFSCATAGSVTAYCFDCIQVGAGVLTVTGGGALLAYFDAASAGSFAAAGTTTSGAVFQFLNQQPTQSRATYSGNSGTLNVTGGKYPTSMMTVTICLTLLTAGTTGTLQAAVTYTDLKGTLKTVNVGGGLNITSATGTEVTGSLTFSQNGSTVVSVAVTGVVTPGALSYSLAFSEQISA